MIDRYLNGRVDRISPEAPVPVLALGGEENRLGGAANVALNLLALGARVHLAGVIGGGVDGDVFSALLVDRGLSSDLMVTDESRPTTVKTRLTADGQQLLRVDKESVAGIGSGIQEKLYIPIATAILEGRLDLVLLQDYNKGVLEEPLTKRILDLCESHGVKTVVDPKDKNFWSFVGCSLFKPNLREIQQQVNYPVRPTQESLDHAAEEIFAKLSCAAIMITLSEHGIYVNDGKSSSIHKTNARAVADVSGAGDTVISVAACGLAAGMNLVEIAALANLAGAQVIAKRGVVAIDLEALRAAYAAS
ncbi:rfaE bifunctional protein kinase chain/domain [Lewinella antarctica]|uniref:RfaE bifunctional protein kinase chain/domain n=2 Tax=Neolewinella antarctica TaxID=442734 RepID=A0ABX0X5W9_9BACT|nr:rfaE bifunctional protein kinase chain/domain [Neolewinella antarctica]